MIIQVRHRQIYHNININQKTTKKNNDTEIKKTP